VINLSITFPNNQICFQVKDQGIGIPSVDHLQVFDSFYRAQNIGTIQGAGLGLSIVKKCVDLQNGTITITSELNLGTTFTVKLPLSFEEKS
jgi:signal transduction histidine kinase